MQNRNKICFIAVRITTTDSVDGTEMLNISRHLGPHSFETNKNNVL